MRKEIFNKSPLIKSIEITVILTIISLIAVFLFPGNIQHAHGEGEQHIALEVCYNDEVIKQFSMTDLKNIAEEEGGGTTPKDYTYSGYNTYPTRNVFKNIRGATVKGILNKALEGKDMSVDELDEDQLIEFMSGGDGNKEYFLKSQLFADRYYFPNDDSKTGKVPVPAVISLTENGKAFGDGPDQDSDVGRLIFGQVELEEQNHAAFIKWIATPVHTGMIKIYSMGNKPSSSWKDKWSPIVNTDHGSGGKVEPNTELTFDSSVNEWGPRYWIHYTIDGTEPDADDEMYNWNSNNHGKESEKFTKPKVKEGLNIIKVKVIGYGKKDSEVTTFTFTGEKYVPPTSNTNRKVIVKKTKIRSIKAKGKKITLKWTKVAGASGYQIYRAKSKKGKYKLIKTTKGNSKVSYVNKGLKKKKTYWYKVRAYKTVSGKKIYGEFSPVKRKKVK